MTKITNSTKKWIGQLVAIVQEYKFEEAKFPKEIKSSISTHFAEAMTNSSTQFCEDEKY